MKWKKGAALAGGVLLVIGAGVIFNFVFFATPRTETQVHIHAFEAVMPNAAAESVPLEKTGIRPDYPVPPDFGLTIAETRENRKKGPYFVAITPCSAMVKTGTAKGRWATVICRNVRPWFGSDQHHDRPGAIAVHAAEHRP